MTPVKLFGKTQKRLKEQQQRFSTAHPNQLLLRLFYEGSFLR
jgi:hypothetical protein